MSNFTDPTAQNSQVTTTQKQDVTLTNQIDPAHEIVSGIIPPDHEIPSTVPSGEMQQDVVKESLLHPDGGIPDEYVHTFAKAINDTTASEVHGHAASVSAIATKLETQTTETKAPEPERVLEPLSEEVNKATVSFLDKRALRRVAWSRLSLIRDETPKLEHVAPPTEVESAQEQVPPINLTASNEVLTEWAARIGVANSNKVIAGSAPTITPIVGNASENKGESVDSSSDSLLTPMQSTQTEILPPPDGIMAASVPPEDKKSFFSSIFSGFHQDKKAA